MRALIFIFALLMCLSSSAEVHYKDRDFSLVLERDWVQLPLAFVEHVAFASESLGLHVKIMGITQRIRLEKTRLAAAELLEESIRRELASAKPGVEIQISRQSVTEIEGGSSGMYRGQDSTGRSFLTLLHIYSSGAVLMFFEAPAAKAHNLDVAASDVLTGLSK